MRVAKPIRATGGRPSPLTGSEAHTTLATETRQRVTTVHDRVCALGRLIGSWSDTKGVGAMLYTLMMAVAQMFGRPDETRRDLLTAMWAV